MRTCLVVANRTLTGPHLVSELAARRDAGPCRFHVLVPATPAGVGRAVWTEGQAHAHARRRLDAALERLRAEGIEATGAIGDEQPIAAIADALRTLEADEIIVSTLPPGLSRWLKLDLPHRVERTFGLPVTHVVAVPEPAA